MTSKRVEIHTPLGLRAEEFVVTVLGEVGVTDVDPTVTLEANKRDFDCEVVGAWTGAISHVPASLLEKHHDPACRTYSSCALVLSVCNGRQINGPDVVTAMIVRPLKRILQVPARMPEKL